MAYIRDTMTREPKTRKTFWINRLRLFSAGMTHASLSGASVPCHRATRIFPMQRSALLLMAVSAMLVLGGPQLAAEEAQRGRARSRGSGQVTAAPQSKSPAPNRAARRVSSNRAGKSTGSRPTSPPKTSAPRRAPGVQSSAPRAGRSNSGTAVGRARARDTVTAPRAGRVTVIGRNRTTSHTRARRRVVETRQRRVDRHDGRCGPRRSRIPEQPVTGRAPTAG